MLTIQSATALALKEARQENEATSQHTYTWHAKGLLDYWGAQTGLDEITRPQVQEWCNWMKVEEGFKPATVRHRLAFFNRLYRIAKDQGVDVPRPSTDLRLPKINNQRKDYAGLEKLEKLRPHIKPWRFSIFQIAFHTGLRRLEIYRLECEDIEIFKDTIEVNGKLVEVEIGYAHVRESKTHEARTVALNMEVTQVIKLWLEIARARNSQYLIGPYRGSRIGQANALSCALRDACKKAGIKVSMHLFRHGFATEATKNGAKSDNIRIQLGHKTVTQTARYQHHDKSVLWPAVFAVSRIAKGV